MSLPKSPSICWVISVRNYQRVLLKITKHKSRDKWRLKGSSLVINESETGMKIMKINHTTPAG